jgi:hydrogenase maturation protease
MKLTPARCLILSCGNTLREDDGVGPWLAEWAEERFAGDNSVRVVNRQQWTPELAEEIAGAQSVVFIDCAANAVPGSIQLVPIASGNEAAAPATHHVGAAELLSLSKELYGAAPSSSLLLTIGAGSLGLREGFSEQATAALPEAIRLLEETVLRLVNVPSEQAETQRM